MKKSNKNLIKEIEMKEEKEMQESANEQPKVYTEEELTKLVDEAYKRGRNEQIESQFVADTSQLGETDGKPTGASAATDISWLRTRGSVW